MTLILRITQNRHLLAINNWAKETYPNEKCVTSKNPRDPGGTVERSNNLTVTGEKKCLQSADNWTPYVTWTKAASPWTPTEFISHSPHTHKACRELFDYHVKTDHQRNRPASCPVEGKGSQGSVNLINAGMDSYLLLRCKSVCYWRQIYLIRQESTSWASLIGEEKKLVPDH